MFAIGADDIVGYAAYTRVGAITLSDQSVSGRGLSGHIVRDRNVLCIF